MKKTVSMLICFCVFGLSVVAKANVQLLQRDLDQLSSDLASLNMQLKNIPPRSLFAQLPIDIMGVLITTSGDDLEGSVKTILSLAQTNKELNTFITDQIGRLIQVLSQGFGVSEIAVAFTIGTVPALEWLKKENNINLDDTLAKIFVDSISFFDEFLSEDYDKKRLKKLYFSLNELAGEEYKKIQELTPAMWALQTGNDRLYNALIKVGVDINAKNYKHDTLLRLAINQKKFKLAKQLLQKGADIGFISDENRKILKEMQKDKEVKELLNMIGKKKLNIQEIRNTIAYQDYKKEGSHLWGEYLLNKVKDTDRAFLENELRKLMKSN